MLYSRRNSLIELYAFYFSAHLMYWTTVERFQGELKSNAHVQSLPLEPVANIADTKAPKLPIALTPKLNWNPIGPIYRQVLKFKNTRGRMLPSNSFNAIALCIKLALTPKLNRNLISDTISTSPLIKN